MTEKADVRELAIAAWRLERWLDGLHVERKQAAKSALRSIKKFLTVSGVVIQDPIGSKFDPGLAIEVINNEDEIADESKLIIVETVSPYVYLNGHLIQHAKVIIGTSIHDKNDGQTQKYKSTQQRATPPKSDSDTGISQEAVSTVGNSETSQASHSDIDIKKEDVERMLRYAKIL